MVLTEQDCRLIAAIQGGLPMEPRPYAVVGEQIGMSEEQVIARVGEMQASGVIKRMGVVVRHHELGYIANAMVVWNVPDERMDEVGNALGSQPCVTLCYQRPRRLPEWPYNLFCMIHGRSRESVLSLIERLVDGLGLQDIEHRVLFSGRRFKQRGARYQ
jgi:DNA-binding Lrp family transcriptional regulator